ncbi:hypothetical protein OG738_43565 [Amycolatopsis sp. NBC_01488]|uniref:hypothetical protein n=1 Tax=Amycolatopsis sp. NBC_01488 TaxID=2903563 RepID=UPI002E2B0DFA|nr:hypothetical protein [Amycolatopsis sp. NBC_01488]
MTSFPESNRAAGSTPKRSRRPSAVRTLPRWSGPASKSWASTRATPACATRAARRRADPHLTGALAATNWRERERHLVAACEYLAESHNALGFTDPIEPRVIHAERFGTSLLAGSPIRLPVGSIDRFADSTDALGHRAPTRAVVDCLHG